MRRYGGGAASNFSLVGQVVGELTEEVLNRTCDNLTRQGLMDAVHSLKGYASDLNLPGIGFTFSDDDHVGIEAMRLLRAKVRDGKGAWEYEGDLLSYQE